MTAGSETTPRLMNSIECRECHESNPEARRFCGSCGSQLWEPCAACGEIAAVDLKYCGKCGVDLEGALAKVASEAESVIAQADELASLGRLQEAVELLQKVQLQSHSRLAGLGVAIATRVNQFPERRRQATAQAHESFETARELAADGKNRESLQLVKSVPQAFQFEELRVLEEKVAPLVAEADRLHKEVQQGLESKQYDPLIPKVERLRRIDAGNDEVHRLSDKLRAWQDRVDSARSKKLLEKARAALKVADYAVAAKAAAQINPEVGRQLFGSTYKETRETVWLATQLRQAPYVSNNLWEIAKRLRERQQGDARVQQWEQEISRRLKKAAAEGEPDSVPWAQPPQQTPLGIPVERLAAPSQLRSACAEKQNEPSHFMAAFGLALQAFGKAVFRFNLTPNKQDLWSGLKNKLRGLQTPSAAWGIDIGHAAIHAVLLELAEAESDEEFVIADVVTLPVNDDSERRSTGMNSLRRELGDEATEWLNECVESTLAIAVGLPGANSLVRTFSLPEAKPERFQEAVRFEVKRSVPIGEDQLVFGYHMAADSGDDVLRDVTAVAASRSHIEDVIAPFNAGTNSPVNVQAIPVAICNAMHFLEQEQDSPGTGAVALLDVGQSTTNVIIKHGDSFWYRALYLGTSGMDELLSKEFKLTNSDAEKIRKEPHRAKFMYRVDELLVPAYDGILQAVQRTITQYQNEQQTEVQRLVVLGGGASQFGLLRYLRFGK